MAELTGQTFAGFEVVAKLGQGGMGAVYKARQPLLDRFVALKVMSHQLSGDSSYVARFVREAASAAKLSHPNMVQVYSAGEQGGIYYIVMEFVEGESLGQRLKRVGALDSVEAIAITLYVAQALQVAWNKAHLIHRDIKPDNIFLSKDGEVKVGDLGLAKSVTEGATDMTQSGMMMGSPHYMSPEQARASKETDFRTDIYSLGCTLYQLLTGTTPYQADDALGVILKHVSDPAPDLQAMLPSCPSALVALVAKMMAKDRNARHASYEELIAELWQVSDLIGQQQSAPTAVMTSTSAPAAATVKPTVVGGGKPVISNWRLVIGGVVAVAALLLIGLFLWSPWKSRTDEQGRREDAKAGSESRLQAESSSGQPAKAGTPNPTSAQPSNPPELQHSAASQLLGNVFTNFVGAEMVYIPPGEFMMGSTKEEQAWAVANTETEKNAKREGEAPRKVVIKQGFWLGRTEVTVGQWKQFVKETKHVTDGEKTGASYVGSVLKNGLCWRNPGFGFEMQDHHAVSCISWNDAVAFCEWLTLQERKAGRLAANMVVRLPTEAEWEYACRAGMQTKFWWGETKEEGRGRANWHGNEDGYDFVAPVDSCGARGRNGFGLADVLGNVDEWCLDEFDATHAHEEYYRGITANRVLRGGSFIHSYSQCRCASRSGPLRFGSASNHGFRVCYGVDVSGVTTKTASTSPAATPEEGGILAPPETRVAALTTNPKVGEVYTLTLGSNVTMELMGIPPGEFMLGSTKEEQAWAMNDAQMESSKQGVEFEGSGPRPATIKHGFWMGRTELTLGQWKLFMKETGYVTDGEKAGEAVAPQPDQIPWHGTLIPKKGASWRNPNFGFEMRDDHPACYMSWNDAVAFCAWLTQRETKAGRLPRGWVARLPTEAEWEYACRAGTQTKFWWGDSVEDGTDRMNWGGKKDGFLFIAPVDSFGARGRNRFGLADIQGNVSEWCLDVFDATRGAHEGVWMAGHSGFRVMRGAAFQSNAPNGWRSAHRKNYPPATSRVSHGFRLVVGVDVIGAENATP